MTPGSFKGVGKCIMCLSRLPDAELTREHIVPMNIGGELIIERAVCDSCRKYGNRAYEEAASYADFYVPRLLLEIKRKRRKNEKRPLPAVAAGNLTMGDDRSLFDLELAISQYPPVFEMLIFEPAGQLIDKDLGGNLTNFRISFVNIGIETTRLVAGGVTMRHQHDHTAFALTLAKIGYCYAVAKRGLDGFNGAAIRDLLLGKRADVYNFVGGVLESRLLTDRELHKLYLQQRGDLLTVIVHLFASCKMLPYEIVVGEASHG
jgi:hypothetical protein